MDLKRHHDPIRDELDRAIGRVIDESAFTLGDDLEEFENEFATYCGAAAAIGVSSGTDALFLSLLACGVRPGDEVITVANTFIATAEAVSMCGARPVFVDIRADDFTLDPALLEAAVTEKTKAIIPVHLYGLPAHMDPIIEIARRHGLKVIEDACQAHGAAYRGRRVGGLGDAGCFSFYPSKNLGGLGDGGMVVTNSEELAQRVRWLRSHGESDKNRHVIEGTCSRLHGLQAAVLRVKLRYLDHWNALRASRARLYTETLKSLGDRVVLPAESGDRIHAFHLYVVRTAQRDMVLEELPRAGVAAGVHYPVPVHLQAAYSHLGMSEGDLPETERAAREIVSLPLYPELTDAEIGLVGEALGALLAPGRSAEVGVAI